MWTIPEREILRDLPTVAPEDRLKLFDSIVNHIKSDKDAAKKRLILSFLAAYLSTIAAGGSSSFSIAEEVSFDVPEILAFAYLLAGVGVSASWSGAFDRLGRLVCRELLRSFAVDDRPVSDFGAGEAKTLVDRGLKAPLVYLKLKQSRVATVALLPGVNVQVPFSESFDPPRSNAPVRESPIPVDPMAVLAEALAPYLLDYVEGAGGARSASKGRSRKVVNRRT